MAAWKQPRDIVSWIDLGNGNGKTVWSKVKELRELRVLRRIQFNWLTMWSRLEKEGKKKKRAGGVERLRGNLEAKDQRF